MKMDAGVDTGPILSQHPLTIDRDDTTGTLSAKISVIGAELLVEALSQYLEGKLAPQPQITLWLPTPQ